MRISDWSSDVCSSDLGVAQPRLEARQEAADVLLAVEPRLEQAAARITEILDELVAKRHPRPIDQIGVRHREPRTAIVIGVEHQFGNAVRSEEHTSELQSLMRISYAVFCLKKKNHIHT